MDAGTIFKVCNMAALAAWVVLVVFPAKRYTRVFTVTIMSSLVFAVVYAISIGISFGTRGGFGSLEEVALLFENPYALLAGWIHYLAFDLFVGTWISANAARHSISRWLILPCQFLTFMFGPIGLLSYLLLRFLMRRDTILEQPF